MPGSAKTMQGLLDENILLKQRIQELEKTESEFKGAEDALRENKERYRLIAENTNDAIYIHDLGGNIIDVNENACQMTGYSREELIGANLALIDGQWHRPIPGDPTGVDFKMDRKKDPVHEDLECLISKGRAIFERRNICKDGSEITIEVSVRVVSYEGRGIVAAFVRDITERKQTEQKLQNTLNFLQTLFNTIPSPIFCKDINGVYVDCNMEFERYTGLERKQIIGKNVYEIFPQDVADKYHEMDLAMLRQPGRQIYEHQIMYADGEKRDVIVNKAAYLNANGSLAGIVGVMVDITDRKRAEMALRRSETKFRMLYDSTNDAVMLANEKSFLDCNKKTLEIFGCKSSDEFCRRHPADLSPPQQPCGRDSELLSNQMIAAALNRGSIQFEWMHKRYDTGEPFPADVLLTAMVLDNEPVVQAVVRDITERKRVEEKNMNMLIFLQTLFDTIPSPIFCKDINGIYLNCNKEFENYTGKKRQEIIGKNAYSMYPNDVADKYHEKDLALFRHPGRQIYEHQAIYPDGERRDVVVNKATYMDVDGKLAGLVGVMVDITERKQAEEELLRYQGRLEKLVEERTRDLENKTKTLEEVNIALKVLLQQREADKKELEDRFLMNVNNLIIPFVEKMNTTSLDERQLAYMNIIKSHLNEITSSLLRKMHQFNLTPTEVEVASLVKNGRSTKEIVQIMGIAASSINTHRNNIRKKLGISKKEENLRARLQSLN